ncbi:hypothetical protein MMSR116_02695 [Methylobacterium mesophilicum SR1.6/6]|uniref:Uncharacterized protein n=1 Tax=Methylobacterium mesophilicum SR1.6/6 TaxID=908290 RepID=A0A6B9FJ52_9HYPH|nr:hypothetical protein [Methylobacterium mesophilicum]QGY00928.1 hypothetical protein MMSR116_02695 [Methylobacterium mesophilicum SR1.6/6]
MHLAILREMRSLGMQLSGHGTVLAKSSLACAKAYVAWAGNLNFMPDRIALLALDDAREWQMDWQTSPENLPRFYMVLNVRDVVEDVSRRYHASPG